MCSKCLICLVLLKGFARNHSAITLLSKQQSVSNLISLTSNASMASTKTVINTVDNPVFASNELWYKKMRQIFLIEYSKYFEHNGFIHLKDERAPPESNTTSKASNQQQTENQTHHFIKWIQQDGFLYVTVNIEEVFMHIKLGYCTRYRLASRTFLNEMLKFYAAEFHIHSSVYDYHLTAINRNFTSSSWGSPKQISLTISKFLDEFVEFFHRVPLFSTNKVFKIVYEKLDYSLIPHKFGLIFDYMISAKKKLQTSSDQANISFTPLYLNLDNNIGIYSISEGTESQKASTPINPASSSSGLDYSKYLVIKIESFVSNSGNSQALSAYSTTSIKKMLQQQMSVPENKLTTTSPQTTKISHSSSSSSLLNIAHQKESSSSNQKASKPPPTSRAASQLPQQQSYIRLVCYYLCINKNQDYSIDTTFSPKQSDKLNADLSFLDKIIEESISSYKQEIFWDNLVISMSSLSNWLNEAHANMPIVFAIQSEELEQILDSSEKIDALELDPALGTFLAQCFSVKEKIQSYFRFNFGRHFIFTASPEFDYCLLLLNDDLLKNFGCSSSSSCLKSSVSRSDSITTATNTLNAEPASQKLESFVLLKFDKKRQTSHLWQVNRVDQKANQQKNTSMSLASAVRIASDNNTSLLGDTASSFKKEQFYMNKSAGSNRYLSFVVNNLMYVIWETLFH